MHLGISTRRCAAKAVALFAVLTVPAALRAQEQVDAGSARWSVEAVALGGPGALVGVGAAVEIDRAAPLRLALEASLLVNVWQDKEFAPCPPRPAPCAYPLKPPYTENLWTLALRGEYPLGASWRVVASTGVVAGEWRRPQGTSPVALDVGLGLARQARSGAHAFVIRGHRIHTHSYPTYAARVAWRLRL